MHGLLVAWLTRTVLNRVYPQPLNPSASIAALCCSLCSYWRFGAPGDSCDGGGPLTRRSSRLCSQVYPCLHQAGARPLAQE